MVVMRRPVVFPFCLLLCGARSLPRLRRKTPIGRALPAFLCIDTVNRFTKTGARPDNPPGDKKMTSLSRRRFVQSSSALSLAAATAGFSQHAFAQEKTVALRLSSSHVADLNSSHFAGAPPIQGTPPK